MGWLKEVVGWSGTWVLTSTALTALLALALISFFRWYRKVLLIDQIPGPKTLPIVGNALEISVEPWKLFQTIMGRSNIWSHQSPIIRVWVGPIPVVQLLRCQQAEVILGSQRHLVKSRDYAFLHPWLGTGLLTSSGNKWHLRRKLLTPAFHFKILESFVVVFNQQSDKMVSLLQTKANGKPFNIFPFITLCTLDIICETAMGININAQDDSESEYVKAVSKMSTLVRHRQVRPWLHPDVFFQLLGPGRQQQSCLTTLHNFSYEAIHTRRKLWQTRKSENKNGHEDDGIGLKERKAFLDLLLEAAALGVGLSDEDIREEVDTFMFEGHDTTAAAINWSLYLLGCNPEIQARVYEELDSIFGDSDRPATMADLRDMKYTENCIKEALRLFPSVPLLARELKEDVVIDNYTIPAGTTLAIMIYCIHRDPEQFPQPEVFDPNRFLPENVNQRHPYAYIPFSGGPRNCIGQKFALLEEKTVVSQVIRRYRIESTTRREDLRVLGELVLRPEGGSNVKLFPRIY